MITLYMKLPSYCWPSLQFAAQCTLMYFFNFVWSDNIYFMLYTLNKTDLFALQSILLIKMRACNTEINFDCVLYAQTTDTQTELFFKNSKLLGLGRQIGPKFYEAFGVFLAKR